MWVFVLLFLHHFDSEVKNMATKQTNIVGFENHPSLKNCVLTPIKNLLNERKLHLNVFGEIVSIEPVREITAKDSNEVYKISEALLNDGANNTIKLVLWFSDADKFRVGDKVLVKNGYTKSFNHEMQLSAGMYGTIELIK